MTLGDQIRRCRLDLGLRQRDLAKRWGFRPETLASWERGLLKPSVRAWPRIIELLGVDPLAGGDSLGARLEAARRRLGLTRQEFAARVGLDEGSICRWVIGDRRPSPWMAGRIQALLEELGAPSKKPDSPPLSYFDLTRWRRRAPRNAHPRTLGDRLRAQRVLRGLTQLALSEIFGVSRGTVQRWESGRKQPHRQRRPKIIQWLEG